MALSILLFLFLVLPIFALLLYYGIILYLASKSGKASGGKRAPPGKNFSLDIVVPIRGEPLDIIRSTLIRNELAFESSSCLKKTVILSDDDQEYFKNLESELKPSGKVSLIRRENPRGGRTGALDDYFSKTDSDYVLVLDVDGQVDSRSMESLCSSLDGGAAYVLPWKGYFLEKTRVAEAMAFFTDFGSLILYKLRGKAGFFVFPVGSGTAYHRDTILGLGGWGDNIVQDDIYMGVKLASKGYATRLLEEGEVKVLVPSKLYTLRKQQARWAYGTSEVLSKSFNKIIRSPLPLAVRLEMIAYMLQPLETLPPFLAFVLSPAIALVDRSALSINTQLLSITGVLSLLVALSVAQGLLLLTSQREFLSGKLKDYVVNLGRFSAILVVLSPHLSIASLKGLARRGIKWEVTPKGEKEKRSPKERTPLYMALWAFIGVASSLYVGNLYTMLISLLFLTASVYTLLRLEP